MRRGNVPCRGAQSRAGIVVEVVDVVEVVEVVEAVAAVVAVEGGSGARTASPEQAAASSKKAGSRAVRGRTVPR
jgi:hypothetical protein